MTSTDCSNCHFSEISGRSCEILFEVWDQGQKIGKSDAFMGLAIVSVSELLATASQRHVVPLQGRPYEEDKVMRSMRSRRLTV